MLFPVSFSLSTVHSDSSTLIFLCHLASTKGSVYPLIYILQLCTPKSTFKSFAAVPSGRQQYTVISIRFCSQWYLSVSPPFPAFGAYPLSFSSSSGSFFSSSSVGCSALFYSVGGLTPIRFAASSSSIFSASSLDISCT